MFRQDPCEWNKDIGNTRCVLTIRGFLENKIKDTECLVLHKEYQEFDKDTLETLNKHKVKSEFINLDRVTKQKAIERWLEHAYGKDLQYPLVFIGGQPWEKQKGDLKEATLSGKV